MLDDRISDAKAIAVVVSGECSDELQTTVREQAAGEPERGARLERDRARPPRENGDACSATAAGRKPSEVASLPAPAHPSPACSREESNPRHTAWEAALLIK